MGAVAVLFLIPALLQSQPVSPSDLLRQAEQKLQR